MSYTDIQEEVIDGVTKYYYFDEAQLVVGYFDTKEEAIKDRTEQWDLLIQELIDLGQYPIK